MRKYLYVIMAVFLLSIVSGCGEEEKDVTKKRTSKDQVDKLSFVTAGQGGTFFPLGGGMAKVINDKGIAQVTVETSGGSVENARLLGRIDADLGLLETGIAYYAAEGIEMFEGEKYENLRGIMTVYPNLLQMVVKADSGIESYVDLKGKKVVVGQPGSSSMLNLELVLNEYGLSIDDLNAQYSGFGEGIDLLKDGQVEATLVDVGVPAPAIIDIATQHHINILSIDEEVIESIAEKYAYFSNKVVIPAGTYNNQDEDIITAGVKVMLATRADLSEELVYNMTKTIFEEKETIANIHSSGENINIDEALESMSIPLHPGAQKYIEEQQANQSL